MDELHRVLRETVDPNTDEAIRAAAFALADVQAELVSVLLAEKAISANALQQMLDDLRTRAYRQPPLNSAENLRRLFVPAIVEHLRQNVDWDREPPRQWSDDHLAPAFGSEPD